ncbi:MAG: hypothetical protein JW779_05790 [Candidatus Thorarchaeota archaeon]|nr:hypothetical protein [Candidatus Thorarchaeota archaeon]
MAVKGFMGQGYASNPMLDMRIYDINTVAQPNRVVPEAPTPEEPTDCDGTTSLSVETTEAMEDDFTASSLRIVTYWAGLWPLLHFFVDAPLAPDQIPEEHPAKPAQGKMLHFHTAKNLLGNIEQQEVYTLGDSSFGKPSDAIIGQQVALLATIIKGSLNLALIGLEIAATAGIAPAIVAFIASTVILTLAFFGMYHWYTQMMLEKGSWTHYTCFWVWLVLGLGFILQMVFNAVAALFLGLIAPMTPVAKVASEWLAGLNPFRAIASGAKLAFFYMLAMAVYCFDIAIRHLIQSF